MYSRPLIFFIVMAALAGVGWFLNSLANPKADSEEIRIQLITELQDFKGFEQHEELFMAVIDKEHQKTFDRIMLVARHGFSWEKYRSTMYLNLVNALQDAGEEDAVIKLDRFRAGG